MALLGPTVSEAPARPLTGRSAVGTHQNARRNRPEDLTSQAAAPKGGCLLVPVAVNEHEPGGRPWAVRRPKRTSESLESLDSDVRTRLNR